MEATGHGGGATGGPGDYLLLEPGVELSNGRYRLISRLGSGGMAAVWLASDELLGRDVAIKLMSETIVDEPAWVERFRREARVAAGLSHPNLIEIYDFEPRGPRPYLVMAHVPGGTLRERIASGDPPPPRRVASELLAALAHMHAAGILHRDVKTSNVMLGADGATRLGDFGISRPADAPAMTATGQVLGSANYMSPEVMAGEPFTVRSDIYSTGVVLREVLEARPDPELEQLVARMAADDPSARPASAQAARREVPGLTPAVVDREETETTRVAGPPPVPAPAPSGPPEPPLRREVPLASDPTPTPTASPRPAPASFEPPPIKHSGSRRPLGLIAAAALAIVVLAIGAIVLLGGGDEGGSGGTQADSGSESSSGSGSGDGSDSSGSGSGSDSESSGSGSSGSGAQGSGGGSAVSVVPEPTASDPELAAQLDAEGKSLIDSGNPEEAIPILRRAVVLSDGETDTYAFALFNLGNALRLAGRPEEAIPVLEARLEYPNQTEAVQAELDQAEADAGL